MENCICLCEAKDMLNQQNLWIPDNRYIEYAIFTIASEHSCLKYAWITKG